MKNTGSKVLVVFRTLPGESNTALVLPIATLPDQYHDAIMTLVETAQAQDAFEFGEMMFIRTFPDGRPMLQAMNADNRLQKVPTDSVEMIPGPGHAVGLHQLNVLIAEQKNCAVDDLYTFVAGAPKVKPEVQDVATVTDLVNNEQVAEKAAPLKANPNEVLSDTDIARNYRSQADSLYKEAARLRKQADELDPPKKKSAKVESAEATV